MSASLTVRYAKTDKRPGTVYSHGLSVEVVNAVDMPKKIFVIYRRVPSNVDPELQDSTTLDEFNHIATVVDLYEVPEDAPEFEKAGSSAYRTAYWEFSFRNPSDLEDSLRLIKKDIAQLVRDFNSDRNVQVYEEETYE